MLYRSTFPEAGIACLHLLENMGIKVKFPLGQPVVDSLLLVRDVSRMD